MRAISTCIFPLFADETSCMTSAHRNDATGHGALMANVAHEEERARHASCTTRLLEYGLSIYRVSRVFDILPLDSTFFRRISISPSSPLSLSLSVSFSASLHLRIYSSSRFVYMQSLDISEIKQSTLPHGFEQRKWKLHSIVYLL